MSAVDQPVDDQVDAVTEQPHERRVADRSDRRQFVEFEVETVPRHPDDRPDTMYITSNGSDQRGQRRPLRRSIYQRMTAAYPAEPPQWPAQRERAADL